MTITLPYTVPWGLAPDVVKKTITTCWEAIAAIPAEAARRRKSTAENRARAGSVCGDLLPSCAPGGYPDYRRRWSEAR
jgi:hypothetical protein